MSRQDRTPEEPSLFDLPLASGSGAASPEDKRRGARGERPLRTEAPESLPLFGAGSTATESRRLHAVPAAERAAPATASAGAGRRWLAGLGDLALHSAVFVLLLAGARALGAEVGAAALAPAGVTLLLFSLLYTVLPLAFWGQTPGMSWAGIASGSIDGEPLSFGQSFRLWLGGLLTLALVGLPALLVFGGRSLSDRLGGARTFAAAR